MSRGFDKLSTLKICIFIFTEDKIMKKLVFFMNPFSSIVENYDF